MLSKGCAQAESSGSRSQRRERRERSQTAITDEELPETGAADISAEVDRGALSMISFARERYCRAKSKPSSSAGRRRPARRQDRDESEGENRSCLQSANMASYRFTVETNLPSYAAAEATAQERTKILLYHQAISMRPIFKTSAADCGPYVTYVRILRKTSLFLGWPLLSSLRRTRVLVVAAPRLAVIPVCVRDTGQERSSFLGCSIEEL